MIEAVSRSVLDGEKLAGIRIVLHVAVRFDEKFVADDETAAPSGHVESFAGGMEFDADVFRARRGEEIQWFAFEHERGVRGVVNDNDVVLFGKGDDFSKKLRRRRSAGWIVWIIDDENFRF